MDNFGSKNSKDTKVDELIEKETRPVRPRSRTVLLTPEMTGEVRSKINNEESKNETSSFSGSSSQEHRNAQLEKKDDINGFCKVYDGIEDSGNNTGVRNNRMATTMATPRPRLSGSNPIINNENAVKGFVSGNQGRVNSSFAPENSNRGNEHVVNRQPSVRKEEKQESIQPVKPTRDTVVYEKPSPLVGFLISYDNDENGEVLELRAGRLIVTSEVSSHGNFVYLNDSSVSPMHAILRIAKGSDIQVLDQLSEFGTKVTKVSDKKVVELSGEKGVVSHGDKISFGERTFEVCLLSA